MTSRRNFIKSITLLGTTSAIGLSGCLEEEKTPEPKITTRQHTNTDLITGFSVSIPDENTTYGPETAYASFGYAHTDQTEWEATITYGSENLGQKQVQKGIDGVSLPFKIFGDDFTVEYDGSFLLTITPKQQDLPTSKLIFTIENLTEL